MAPYGGNSGNVGRSPRAGSSFLSWRTLFQACALLSSIACVNAADFYKLLGISRDATHKEIKKAYRQKSLELHPDKNKEEGAAEKFAEVARAYEVLTDEDKKGIYDKYGEEGLEQHEQQGGRGGGGDPFGDIFEHFGFGGGGGGGRRRNQEQTTPSVEIPLWISMKQAFKGDTIEVEYVRQVLCVNWQECTRNMEDCHGPGVRVRMQQLAPGFVQQVQQRDDRCISRGKMWRKDCRECPKGQTETEKIDLTIDIPPGIRPGERITFENVADERPGYTAGDLHFLVHEYTDDQFHRDRDHLYMTMEVPLVDALTGFSFKLPHLDGEEFEVNVSDVTECDHVLRVPGKGMPRRNGRGKGDLFITFDVDFPDTLTQEQKDSIRKILSPDGASDEF
mmetsp:Transcript_1131/g.1428  ORF Transcript_1131/g.1428 Transcript_1131/m.1428 type:complete len:392 (+) Transcript_1131:71-1246(+)